MRRSAVVVLLGLVGAGCATFGEGPYADRAQAAVQSAHASGDATLSSYAERLLREPSDATAIVTERCLSSLIAGMEQERHLAADSLSTVKQNVGALERVAHGCISLCANFGYANPEADDFENSVAADVYRRCQSRWGAHQENIPVLGLEARMPTLESIAKKREFISLQNGLAELQRELDVRTMLRLADGATTARPAAMERLDAEIKSLRTKYHDELSRVREYQRDPQVVAATARLRRVQDEMQVLLDVVRGNSNCTHEVGHEAACEPAQAASRVARARLDDLGAEQDQLIRSLYELREAAGLDKAAGPLY